MKEPSSVLNAELHAPAAGPTKYSIGTCVSILHELTSHLRRSNPVSSCVEFIIIEIEQHKPPVNFVCIPVPLFYCWLRCSEPSWEADESRFHNRRYSWYIYQQIFCTTGDSRQATDVNTRTNRSLHCCWIGHHRPGPMAIHDVSVQPVFLDRPPRVNRPFTLYQLLVCVHPFAALFLVWPWLLL